LDTYNRIAETDTPTSDYKKSVRFNVRNLPNWYRIKSTKNAVKILLLSFGLVGDLIEFYTNDYETEWIPVKASSTIPQEILDDPTLFPTPHMGVGIDIGRSDDWKNNIPNILNSLDSIRPANVVFDTIYAYMDIPKVTILVRANSSLLYTVDMRYTNNTSGCYHFPNDSYRPNHYRFGLEQ
jgi:hypothetical protein